jgi:hypothetical protein
MITYPGREGGVLDLTPRLLAALPEPGQLPST